MADNNQLTWLPLYSPAYSSSDLFYSIVVFTIDHILNTALYGTESSTILFQKSKPRYNHRKVKLFLQCRPPCLLKLEEEGPTYMPASLVITPKIRACPPNFWQARQFSMNEHAGIRGGRREFIRESNESNSLCDWTTTVSAGVMVQHPSY